MAVVERPEEATQSEGGGRITRDSIADVWGERTPHAGEWPARVDERTLEAPDRWVQSACVLCSTGCALDIGVKGGRIVGVRGREVDRVNRGRLGPKGLHGWKANASPDRLTRPLIRRNGALQPATWDEAWDLLIGRMRAVIDRYTAGAVGIYNSGQLMLEEYYTLACVMEAGVHTNHMDGNTRLCTATAAQALIQSFGSDGDPGSYRDLDLTDALFLVGHNPANTQTILWMRILDRLHSANRPRLVVVDPRRTQTAAEADVHLRPRLGTNVALLNGLLYCILRDGRIDQAYIDAHTMGFENLKETVAGWPRSGAGKGAWRAWTMAAGSASSTAALSVLVPRSRARKVRCGGAIAAGGSGLAAL